MSYYKSKKSRSALNIKRHVNASPLLLGKQGNINITRISDYC